MSRWPDQSLNRDTWQPCLSLKFILESRLAAVRLTVCLIKMN